MFVKKRCIIIIISIIIIIIIIIIITSSSSSRSSRSSSSSTTTTTTTTVIIIIIIIMCVVDCYCYVAVVLCVSTTSTVEEIGADVDSLPASLRPLTSFGLHRFPGSYPVYPQRLIPPPVAEDELRALRCLKML